MTYKVTWWSHVVKTANFIDYIIIYQRLRGSIQAIRCRSSVAYIKSKGHHLIVSRVNLKLKFRTVKVPSGKLWRQ